MLKKSKGMGEGETSRSPWQCSLCLRVITPGNPKVSWYVHNISISDETVSSIQPCYQDKLKRMSKDAKKRVKDARKRLDEWEERKFNHEILEDEPDDEATMIVYPICNTPDISSESCWTSLGSTIYCLGSVPDGGDFSNEVRCFGLFDPHNSWEWGPSMMNGRLLGKAVTLDDKVYVFGGTKDYAIGPWAEVLEKDGTVWKWKALKKPPLREPIFHIYASSYIDDGKNKILVGSHSTLGLYAYCPASDLWEVVGKNFCLTLPCFTNPVVVEKTMYWVGDESICAYDLDTKVLYSGRIHFWGVKNALEFAKLRRTALPFFHLHDDMFLLIWHDTDFSRNCPRSEFVLHKFRVSKRVDPMGGKCSLSIKAVDIEYILTGQNFFLFDGMLLK